MSKRIKNRQGFTLIELLIVLVIIGLLAGLVGPRVFRGQKKGNIMTAKAQVELLGQALDQFRLDTGQYPTSSEGLQALLTDPGAEGWDGPYLKKAIPKDPWKNAYVYRSPGTHGDYDLLSYGKGGVEGGEDEEKDIVSWE